MEKHLPFIKDGISHSWDVRGTKAVLTAAGMRRGKDGHLPGKGELAGRPAPYLRHAGRKVLCPAVDAGECSGKRIWHSPLNAAYRGTSGKRIGMEARENGEDIPRKREEKCLFERLVFRTRPEMGEINCREVHGEPLRLALAILENGADALHRYRHSVRGIWNRMAAGRAETAFSSKKRSKLSI